MLARVLLYVLMIPVVVGATTYAHHELTGRTYCLDDFLAAGSAQARDDYCMSVPTQFSEPLDKPDWSGLFAALGG